MKIRTYDGFGYRVVSAENTARYAAMLAGDEWIGTFQYGNARNAASAMYDATGGDEAAAVAAANLFANVQELPPAGTWCDNPDPEKAWNVACVLFAYAACVTTEEADARLREDYKYFLWLSVQLIHQWHAGCEAGEPKERAMPLNLWRHLEAFMSAECGVDTDRYSEYMKDSHHRTCSRCKRD